MQQTLGNEGAGWLDLMTFQVTFSPENLVKLQGLFEYRCFFFFFEYRFCYISNYLNIQQQLKTANMYYLTEFLRVRNSGMTQLGLRFSPEVAVNCWSGLKSPHTWSRAGRPASQTDHSWGYWWRLQLLILRVLHTRTRTPAQSCWSVLTHTRTRTRTRDQSEASSGSALHNGSQLPPL